MSVPIMRIVVVLPAPFGPSRPVIAPQFAVNVTPTWVSGFDLFPLEGIDNKTRLLGQAAAEGWWCSFGHDPACAFAKVEVREGKWLATEKIS